jgi:hypothetical protein
VKSYAAVSGRPISMLLPVVFTDCAKKVEMCGHRRLSHRRSKAETVNTTTSTDLWLHFAAATFSVDGGR